jgi:hypothetical protein
MLRMLRMITLIYAYSTMNTQWLRYDYAMITQWLHNSYAYGTIFHELLCNHTHVTQCYSGLGVFTQDTQALRTNYASIKQRLRNDYAMITQWIIDIP